MPSTYAGTATDHASITIPDDADPITASSVNVPLEQLKDLTEFLRTRSAYYFAAAGPYYNTNEPANDVAPSLLKKWTGTTYSDANLYEVLSLSAGNAPQLNDIVEFEITCNVSWIKAASTVDAFVTCRPFVQQNGGAWTKVDGSLFNASMVTADAGVNHMSSVTFKFVVGVTAAGTFKVALNGRVDAVTDTPSVEVDEGFFVVAKIWRPTA